LANHDHPDHLGGADNDWEPAMTKEETITKIMSIRDDIKRMSPRKGRAEAMRSITKTVAYLNRYRVGSNLCTLLYKEVLATKEKLPA